MTYTCVHDRNPLEISELAAFDANIAPLPPEEQSQRRKAYLAQAMLRVGYGKSMMASMGCFFIPFLIIPVFWPFIIVFYLISRKSQRMIDNYVDSACRYWNIDKRDLSQPRDWQSSAVGAARNAPGP